MYQRDYLLFYICSKNDIHKCSQKHNANLCLETSHWAPWGKLLSLLSIWPCVLQRWPQCACITRQGSSVQPSPPVQAGEVACAFDKEEFAPLVEEMETTMWLRRGVLAFPQLEPWVSALSSTRTSQGPIQWPLFTWPLDFTDPYQ